MVYCPVLIRKPRFADPGPRMPTHYKLYQVTSGKRLLLAVLTLVLALTNSQVPAALAASPATQSDIPSALPISAIKDSSVETGLDSTESATSTTIAPTVQEVLLSVCTSNGYGQECAQTLLGMLWNESSNISTAIGDNGRARGYFQIHYKLHKISIDCAEDLVCSADWTIHYMEAHSYPKYVNYAVQCHNSCNVNNGYAAKAMRNGKRFWNRPLPVKQAAPITLAMK